jgi:hypothetical protein
MSLAVKVDIKPKSFKGIAKKRQAEIKAGITKALSKTAQVGINIILDRTEKGQGYEGKFKPYSKGYAIAKKNGWPRSKDRRSFSGDASGIVNLNVTGTMIGGMTSKANSKRAVIFFTNPKITKKAVHNNKTRPFFGFNRLEEKQLAETFERFLP